MAQAQQTTMHQQLGRRLRSLSTDRGTAEALGADSNGTSSGHAEGQSWERGRTPSPVHSYRYV